MSTVISSFNFIYFSSFNFKWHEPLSKTIFSIWNVFAIYNCYIYFGHTKGIKSSNNLIFTTVLPRTKKAKWVTFLLTSNENTNIEQCCYFFSKCSNTYSLTIFENNSRTVWKVMSVWHEVNRIVRVKYLTDVMGSFSTE